MRKRRKKRREGLESSLVELSVLLFLLLLKGRSDSDEIR